METNIENANLFMMCRKLNTAAMSDLPTGFHFRLLRAGELDIWKKMPFDDQETADKYFDYMTEYTTDEF